MALDLISESFQGLRQLHELPAFKEPQVDGGKLTNGETQCQSNALDIGLLVDDQFPKAEMCWLSP